MNKKNLSIVIIASLIVIIGVYFGIKNVKNLNLEKSSLIEKNLLKEKEIEKQSSKNTIKDFCEIGSFVEIAGVSMKVTGIEKYTFEGKEVDLCCQQINSNESGELVKGKNCQDSSGDYRVIWMTNKELGDKLIKFSESYLKNNKKCTKIFNPKTEELIAENCK